MRLAIIVIAVQFLLQSIVFAVDRYEYPDLFSYQAVRINAEEEIGLLLAAGGMVLVDGSIHRGMLILDGDVTLSQSARIDGFILVLGGNLIAPKDKRLPSNTLIISPLSYPMANLVIGGLLAAILLFVILLPLGCWLCLYFLRNMKAYRLLKEAFLQVQHQWPWLYLLSGLFISSLMLAVFAELAFETFLGGQMEALDSAIIWLVRYKASTALDKIMIWITSLGYGYFYLVLVAVVFFILAIYKRRREFAALAVCLAGGSMLNEMLKLLFGRVRPDFFRVVEATGYSFPSGHAMVSLCFYGMVSYLLLRQYKKWSVRYIIIVLTVLLIMSIGVSRIYLGVHYPSDVLAGYAAGSMWLSLCISLLMWWERDNIT